MKIYTLEELNYNLNHPSVFENEANPKRREAIAEAGLYFISNTIINPITKEEYYLIKVGMSKNLEDRMKGYRSMNPFLYHIDFFYISNKKWVKAYEDMCHHFLNGMGLTKMEGADEWYLVDKELYFEMCEKGFDFFKRDILNGNRAMNDILPDWLNKCNKK